MTQESVFDPEKFHRTAKLFLDSGEVKSPEEATERLHTFRVAVLVGPEIIESASMQAALLTIVNASARSLLGGIHVFLPPIPIELCVPFLEATNLSDAITWLGGKTGQPSDLSNTPVLVLGTPDLGFNVTDGALRVTFDQWTAGVAPVRRNMRLAERDGCVLAGILAGALGVSEVFQYLRGRNGMSMRRAIGISLWEPETKIDWHTKSDEPNIEIAPDHFWLIGLGNLGQAYLWVIGLIPYAEPKKVKLTLQDIDVLSNANISTSLLTRVELVGQNKTRAMATWAERRGFSTNIVERLFPGNMHIDDGEPSLALCGLDNATGRRKVDDAGFDLILEAGLGAGERYLNIDTHVFPGLRNPKEVWTSESFISPIENLINQPGYKNIMARGMDQCGLIQLASKSVGVPFVGVVAATLVLAAAFRHTLGASRIHQISLNLSVPEDRTVFKDNTSYPLFNPGCQRLLTTH